MLRTLPHQTQLSQYRVEQMALDYAHLADRHDRAADQLDAAGH
jgi:hypothetical protein